MEKRSTTMLGNAAVRFFLGIVCLVLTLALIKDCYKSGDYNQIGHWGLILIVDVLGLVFLLQAKSCTTENNAIFALTKVLDNEYIPFQPKNKLPKNFEEFKKNFKKTNFLDFYAAEVKMDEFEQIHVRFKDKKGNITDQKIISATDFCRYFQVIE